MDQITKINANEARKHFSEIVGRVTFGDEAIIITRSGKESAVMISIEDFKHFQELEDEYDRRAARKALENNSFEDWDEIKNRYGV
jgi:prevent-host-death family protein